MIWSKPVVSTAANAGTPDGEVQKMILFRADGNPQLGSGHIMRCLSLADAFREKGVRSTFVIAEPYMRALVQERGYECLVLDSAYDHLEEELSVFLPLLEKKRPAFVILDSYFVTPDYMAAIKSKVLLAYIDDLNMFDYPADLVVNYMLYADRFVYPKSKHYLLGPQYAPLRKEFQGIPRRTEFGPVRNVLVSAGGADPEHVALECVRYLREHKAADGITYHLVVGAMNRDAAAIKSLADDQEQIVLHRQMTDMRSLMLSCDAAISAGGTTLFEICACGLPAVTYVLADNQIMNAASFEDTGLMLCAGDIRRNKLFTEQLFERLDMLIVNSALRRKMSEQMQGIIDGHGAERLVSAVDKYVPIRLCVPSQNK